MDHRRPAEKNGFGGQAAAEDAKIPEILEQGMFIKLSGGSPPQ
jgi:hypothetical protein